MNMKKMKNWVLAATLICGATTFTSCTNEDNPATPDLNVAEKILGKWMTAEIDGNPALTDEKSVFTFVSTTKAFACASKNTFSESNRRWSVNREYDVEINGNNVKLTSHSSGSSTLIKEFSITSINDTEIVCRYKHTTVRDGQITSAGSEQIRRYTKIIPDYRETVLGLWECTGLTGGETFNDANARLEFLADGTYRYYRMDDNNDWQAVTTREFQDYFVDGTMLATRWKNQGEDELREWWEIESLSGNEMVWKAMRQKEDGSTFQQEMTWKRVLN
jgi:hypothetical protein